jgi:hypothetical protein
MAAPKKQQPIEYDPDPLTIALAILTAITPIGAIIVEKSVDARVENQRRQREIRNALYKSARALNETERVLRDFVSYIKEQGMLDRQVGLGSASLRGDSSVITELKLLYRDSCSAGLKLNDAMIDLSYYLLRNDFVRVKNLSARLGDAFHQARHSRSYKDYVVATSRLIHETRRLLELIGSAYGFNLGEDQLFP